jgi:uncharacterized membrane protein SpoIIM required for sporulation
LKQALFEERFAPRWNAFSAWLSRHGHARARPDPAAESFADEEFPERYRQICHHLALARDRHYAPDLIDRLNAMALRGQHLLYGARTVQMGAALDFIAYGFPRLVREEWRAMLASIALFFIPLLALTWLVAVNPDAAYYLLDPESLSRYQDMYSDAARVLGRRGAEQDITMFAFYVAHNTTIGFQTFAGGILFGLGTVFFLLSNGVQIGAVGGYLSGIGLGHNFWTFVAGHSAPELVAIGVSGAAGFRLAQALLAPGRYSRKQAMAVAGRRAVRLMLGAAGLFLMAAFIEGFWSPHRWFPDGAKYAAGVLLWTLLIAYLTLSGRGRTRAGPP